MGKQKSKRKRRKPHIAMNTYKQRVPDCHTFYEMGKYNKVVSQQRGKFKGKGDNYLAGPPYERKKTESNDCSTGPSTPRERYSRTHSQLFGFTIKVLGEIVGKDTKSERADVEKY